MGSAFTCEGEFKICQGTSAALWHLLWLAIMLALYYMRHYGSSQEESFASDLDKCHSAHIYIGPLRELVIVWLLFSLNINTSPHVT